MAQVLRRRGRIQVKLDSQERTALLAILDRLMPQLEAATAHPRAYDEASLQAEYERWVGPEIARGLEADIAAVRDSLQAGDSTLPLTEAQALSWLRAFNHLRLAAGEVLHLEADGWEETIAEDARRQPEFGILIALGYLQEELIAALDS